MFITCKDTHNSTIIHDFNQLFNEKLRNVNDFLPILVLNAVSLQRFSR